MKIISHRGNVDGSHDAENTWAAISNALSLGFDVELDVWLIDGKLLLGHDEPGELVDSELLKDGRLWCHAKNLDALRYMHGHGIHCFWHEEDRCTITSRGIIWCYPGVWLDGAITVVKGPPHETPWHRTGGICTDYPIAWKKII